MSVIYNDAAPPSLSLFLTPKSQVVNVALRYNTDHETLAISHGWRRWPLLSDMLPCRTCSYLVTITVVSQRPCSCFVIYVLNKLPGKSGRYTTVHREEAEQVVWSQ